MNRQLTLNFFVKALTKLPVAEVGEAPEEWVARCARANDVMLTTRVDERALWLWMTSQVHPPYRWKTSLGRYEGEPDMEQVEEWACFRREVLASPALGRHGGCCLAHGCEALDRLCPVLKHYLRQEDLCPRCPSPEEISAGFFNDADVAVLEEWGLLDASLSKSFDEAWMSLSSNAEKGGAYLRRP